MIPHQLQELIKRYESAPKEFQATQYWEAYKKPILEAISSMDVNELRSGRYNPVRSFGFNETVFFGLSFRQKLRTLAYVAWKLFVKNEHYLPYRIDLSDLREMAYRHCKVYGELTGAKDIDTIEVSQFGNPADIFRIGEGEGKWYSMQFLGYYIRYCFAHRHIRFRGDETIVELGSGSGHQVELLKKLYPGLTILCFDLPAQIYLCESYLTQALGKDNIVSSGQTMDMNNLTKIEKGKVHFLGSWQIPLLQDFSYDIFWNAASFDEMEPEVVKNYLRFVKSKCKYIYLLQAWKGKEASRVNTPMTFNDFNSWLDGYELLAKEDAYRAHMRLKESGGYFNAVWKQK